MSKRVSKSTAALGAIDIILVLAALAFAWVTLTYPFGRDEGLYYYVGREWALHGSIPYRDVFDHKTPAIYILNAATVLLFGERLYGIRAAEIVCILGLGWVAGGLATARGEKAAPGIRGLGCLAASIFYFGLYDFRETAEGEVWLATFGLASCLAVSKIQRLRLAEIIGGALSGAAMMMKPSAVWFVFIAYGVLILRTRDEREGIWRRAVEATLWFGAGFALIWLPIMTYLAAHSAVGPMIDIVVHANAFYVVHEPGVKDAGDIVMYTQWYFHWIEPFSGVVSLLYVAAFAHAAWRRDRVAIRRHVFAAFAIGAGWASVTMQGKFYLGHWSVMVGPVTVVIVDIATDVIEWTRRTERSWGDRVVAPASAVAVVLLYFSGAFDDSVPVKRYIDINRSAVRMIRGEETRNDYLVLFMEHSLGAPARDNELVGNWLREHSQPDDFISVRGFQPQIYAVAQRRYPGRFFWTTFIISPTRAYKRKQWLAEDNAALTKNPPRFVVVLTALEGNNDGAAPWIAQGYVRRQEIGDFTILERGPTPT